MPNSVENIKVRVLALVRSAKEQESNPDFAWRIMAGFFFVIFLGILVVAFISYRWAASNELATPIPKGERSPVSGAEIAEAASIYEKRAAEHEILKQNPTRAPNMSKSGIPAPVSAPEAEVPPADAEAAESTAL